MALESRGGLDENSFCIKLLGSTARLRRLEVPPLLHPDHKTPPVLRRERK